MIKRANLREATYGCELELGDVDTKIKLPRGNTWDYRDASVMNSNGTANDPEKVLNRYGGEIQVKHSDTPGGLLLNVSDVYAALPKKDFNFTTNLHVHIRVPGLRDDVKALKKIAEYLRVYGPGMFELIDPIPVPTHYGYNSSQAFKGAMKRYKRRKRSHHTLPSERVFELLKQVQTPKEFYYAHAPWSERLKRPQFHLMQRPGVNLTQLWAPTETIEFRCFTMSPADYMLLSAFRFVYQFLKAALFTGETPKQILHNHQYHFQKFWPYNYRLDRIFQMTNVRHNKREVAAANYAKLILAGKINEKDLH